MAFTSRLPKIHMLEQMVFFPMSWLVLETPFFAQPQNVFFVLVIYIFPTRSQNLPRNIYIYDHINHHEDSEDVKLMALFFLGPAWTNQVDMNLPNLLPGQRSPCRWGFLWVLSSGILHWTTGSGTFQDQTRLFNWDLWEYVAMDQYLWK